MTGTGSQRKSAFHELRLVRSSARRAVVYRGPRLGALLNVAHFVYRHDLAASRMGSGHSGASPYRPSDVRQLRR
jgi:hypothetical protein